MGADGFINVLKPPGMTSHDVVAWLRKQLGTKKIGHTGTLDPQVPGVLVLAVGRATRLIEYLVERPKSYRCELTLGLTTDTQDAGGNILEQKEVLPEHLERCCAVFAKYGGRIQQIPPMYSAVHHHGKRLYELARQGIEVERTPRDAYIYHLDIIDESFSHPPYQVLFDVTCSKGTYIRTLCHDLGQELGCGGVMSFLLRTAAGPFTIEEAWTLTEIEHAVAAGNQDFLLAMNLGIAHLPSLLVPQDRIAGVLNGVKIPVLSLPTIPEHLNNGDLLSLYGSHGMFLGIGCRKDDHIQISKVFK